MKKLMIAAVAAVVAGGIFAADGYDFTATLKTTKGKLGKDTATVNLGANADGTKFWYQAPTVLGTYFTENTDAKEKYTKPVLIKDGDPKKYFEYKSVKGTTVPVITAEGKDNKDVVETLRALDKDYGYTSAGVYCLTFKVTAEDCYRVAGTVKIDVDLFTSNCCAITAGNVSITNYFGGEAGGIYIYKDEGLMQRFGSLNTEKATKVEMYGFAEKLPEAADNRQFKYGYLAGQGTYSTKDKRVDSISGNIVGVMTPPKCTNCCAVARPAGAFICDKSAFEYELNTAAFGTFRLKYNKNNTQD